MTKNHFWMNTNQSRWPEDESRLFFPRITPTGDTRQVQNAFTHATEGDTVLIFRMMPVRRVIAIGQIERGLHKDTKDGYNTPVEGIIIKRTKLLEGTSWDVLVNEPKLARAKPITSDNAISFAELSKAEFNVILEKSR